MHEMIQGFESVGAIFAVKGTLMRIQANPRRCATNDLKILKLYLILKKNAPTKLV